MTTLPLFRAHSSRHSAPRRPGRLALWLAGLLHWLRTGEFRPAAPCLPPFPAEDGPADWERPTADEVEAAKWLEYGERASVPMGPDPAVVPFTGWQVPDEWRLPGGRGLMFVRPGKQPWFTGQQPACAEPEPGGPARAWDPGDGLAPDVPLARPWTESQVAYGVDRCQLDVADAERQFALALGPDGCEETP